MKAATAFKTWRKTTSKERAAVLRRIGDLLLAKKEELGAILTREQGKPRGEAEGEVGATALFWLVLRLSRPPGRLRCRIFPFLRRGVQAAGGRGVRLAGTRQAVPLGEGAAGGGCDGLPVELPHWHAGQEG